MPKTDHNAFGDVLMTDDPDIDIFIPIEARVQQADSDLFADEDANDILK